MIRDSELNRLIKYAQGMGVAVRFKTHVKGSDIEAEWALDGTEITIYLKPRCSKISKILSLIHELSHHKAFVEDDRTVDPKIDSAINSETNTKAQRKHLLDMEAHDSQYWEQIYKDTNCQFDVKILEKQRELDIWMYEVYYEKNRYPTVKEAKEKKKELKKKYE